MSKKTSLPTKRSLAVEVTKIVQAIDAVESYTSRRYPGFEPEIKKTSKFVKEVIERTFPHLKGKIEFKFNGDSQSDSMLWSIGGSIAGALGGWVVFGGAGAIGGALLGGGAGYLVSKIEIEIVREDDHFRFVIVPS